MIWKLDQIFGYKLNSTQFYYIEKKIQYKAGIFTFHINYYNLQKMTDFHTILVRPVCRASYQTLTRNLWCYLDNHSADLVLILMLVLIPALMIIFQLNRIDYFPTIGETSNASISVWLMVLQVPKYNEITILTKLIQEWWLYELPFLGFLH